jgi:hypothetical protein
MRFDVAACRILDRMHCDTPWRAVSWSTEVPSRRSPIFCATVR